MTDATEVITMTHIVKTPNVCGGRPRIAGRRIRVQDIYVWHAQEGVSVAELAAEYDLTPGQVYAALSYAYDHLAEIQADLRRTDAIVAESMRLHPSPLDEKLAAQDE